MKETVNQRFNKAVNYLLETKRALSKKQIAESLDVSPSYFTEILKERLKISGDLLQIFLSKWQVNPNFIFSNSEQILEQTFRGYEDIASAKEPFQRYTPQSEEKAKSFILKNFTIGNITIVSIEDQQEYLLHSSNPQYIESLPIFTFPQTSANLIRAFEVEGNSMSPTFTHGDIIFAEWIENLEDITDDLVYVIVTQRDGILIRRINEYKSESDYIIAKADSFINKRQYPNLKIPLTDIVELWKAKMCLNTNFTNPQSIWEKITSLEAAIEDLKKPE